MTKPPKGAACIAMALSATDVGLLMMVHRGELYMWKGKEATALLIQWEPSKPEEHFLLPAWKPCFACHS